MGAEIGISRPGGSMCQVSKTLNFVSLDIGRTMVPMSGQDPHGNPDSYPPRAVLIALGFVLLLVLGGLFLFYALRDRANLQDCVMQGRSNCSPVDSTPAATE
jgi:hypothetical protein